MQVQAAQNPVITCPSIGRIHRLQEVSGAQIQSSGYESTSRSLGSNAPTYRLSRR